VEIGRHVDVLEREGATLTGAAEKAGLAAQVPTCPEWTVRDLLRHTGYVHRWAATYVREARKTMLSDDEEEAAVGPLPDDAGLLPWFREGHAALVAALRAAPADLVCWHFLTAPSPLAFWARRQAHETAIHRSDAEAATGEIAGVSAEFALDGIDELLLGFYARRGGRLRAEEPRRLLVRPTDAPADLDVPATAWTVEIGPDGATPRRGDGDADCALRGPASDLYLALWNRRSTDDLHVEGDRAVLDLWRERATVRWT
jgi:uncharacterized protein (TIGR03083 family)